MNENSLKRVQLIIAVLAGVVTLIVGAYNAKNLLFPKAVKPGEMIVTVLSGEGPHAKPVPSAMVELYTAENTLLTNRATDHRGQFAQKGLDPGSYNLKISYPGYERALVPLSVQSGKVSHYNLGLRATGSPVRNALEEAGASWIRKLGTSKTDTSDSTP